jgi:hypothetical protein
MLFEDKERFDDDDNSTEESDIDEEEYGDESSDDDDIEVDPEETAAEKEIEGDFEYVLRAPKLEQGSFSLSSSRIIQGIREQDAASGAAVLSKDWDFNFIAEKEAEFRDDLREASGVGRKKKVCIRPFRLSRRGVNLNRKVELQGLYFRSRLSLSLEKGIKRTLITTSPTRCAL